MPETKTITLDGHTVELTTEMSGRDIKTILEFSAADAEKHLPRLLDVIERHVVKHDFPDPDILGLPIPTLTELFTLWQKSDEDDALPPAQGGTSGRRSGVSRSTRKER